MNAVAERVVEQVKFANLDSAIVAACEQNPASAEAASEYLLGILAQDRRLYEQSHNYLLELAARDLCNKKIRKIRIGLFRESPAIPAHNNQCLRKLTSVVTARGLLGTRSSGRAR